MMKLLSIQVSVASAWGDHSQARCNLCSDGPNRTGESQLPLQVDSTPNHLRFHLQSCTDALAPKSYVNWRGTGPATQACPPSTLSLLLPLTACHQHCHRYAVASSAAAWGAFPQQLEVCLLNKPWRCWQLVQPNPSSGERTQNCLVHPSNLITRSVMGSTINYGILLLQIAIMQLTFCSLWLLQFKHIIMHLAILFQWCLITEIWSQWTLSLQMCMSSQCIESIEPSNGY
jgi:hypothetical protein